MSLLKPHVAAMKQGFYPSLLALSDALSTPAGLRAPRQIETVDAGMAGWTEATKRLVKVVEALASGVFNVDICSESSRQALNRDFDSAITGLIDVYADLLRVMHLEPGRPSETLERAARANLEGIAMWLSTMIMMLDRPEIIVASGGAREFNLTLSYPESREELDDWVIKPTGYDGGHVRAAVDAACRLSTVQEINARAEVFTGYPTVVDTYRSNAQRQDKKKSGSGWSTLFWGGLLGLFIADALGDDCDVDCGD